MSFAPRPPASSGWRDTLRTIGQATRRGWARRGLPFWVVILAAPTLAGYVFAMLVLFPAPIFASAQTVPRVVGTESDAAQATLEGAGLTVGITEQVPHPEQPRGTVVWQDPPPGVRVAEGSAVQLFVSSGPQRVPVPDLTGYEARLAQQLITAAGLRMARIDSTQAPVPAGVVVNTRPPAGTTLLPGSGVTLVVSVGAPTITVPDLRALTRDDARWALEQVGLTLGTALYRTSGLADPGTIIGQDPAAGTLTAPGTAVNVTLARTP